MNNQYLQFVREQLMIATADLSGATKVNWKLAGKCPVRYRALQTQKIRYRDEVTGK